MKNLNEFLDNNIAINEKVYYSKGSNAIIHSTMLANVNGLTKEIYDLTGKTVHISSAYRDEYNQARVVYGNWKKHGGKNGGRKYLVGLYANDDIANAVSSAYENGTNKKDSIKRAEQVLKTYIKRGKYMSNHQLKDAIDITYTGLSSSDRSSIKNLVKSGKSKYAKKILDEGDHLHVKLNKSSGESVDDTEEDNGIIAVLGGLRYATPDWMKGQWKKTIGDPGDSVLFFKHGTTLSDIKSKHPNVTINGLIGFSAGGSTIWPHINSSIPFIGLIDPSSKTAYKHADIPSNVKIMSNSDNWTGYPTIAKVLREMEVNGASERVTIPHNKIPTEFFNRYKSELQLLVSNGGEYIPPDDSGSYSSGGSDLIAYGSRGEDVTKVQQALIDKGYTLPKYGVDGKFASETRGAVKLFQEDNNLLADGIVGPNTKAVLFGASNTTTPIAPTNARSIEIYNGAEVLHTSSENGMTYILKYSKDTKVFNAIPKSKLRRNDRKSGVISRGTTTSNTTANILTTNASTSGGDIHWKSLNGKEAIITNKQDYTFFEILFNEMEGVKSSTGSKTPSSGSFTDLGTNRNETQVALKGAQIANKLVVDLSLTKEQAAGVAGNLWAESGFIPDRLQGSGVQVGTMSQSGGGGYSWAQWTHQSRKDKFSEYAASNGVDLSTQHATDDIAYGFLVKELGASRALKNLRTATDVIRATDIVLKQYEMPADQSSRALNKRVNYANAVLSKMA